MEWPEIHASLGGRSADATAVEALGERVRRWAQNDLGSRGWHVVDDAVEDTLAEVVVKLAQARGPDTFGGFVAGIYYNVRRRLIREHARPADSIDDLDPPADEPEPVDDEHVAVLRRCLDRLAPRLRQAVDARYFGESSYDEVGQALRTTQVNARQLVFRALGQLRRCIQESGRGA